MLELLGDTKGKTCLLVTNGDNNGALNWYFREHGGQWTWADVSGENNDQIASLLHEPVHAYREDRFNVSENTFDCVVSIDVLEHLIHDLPFLCEVKRVLKAGGKAVVTVPNGDDKLLANKIKWKLGMTPEIHRHTRAGYTVAELSDAIRSSGLKPQATGGDSRFFTEMIELVINFGYVRVLAKKRGGAQPGHIAPVSSGELKTHGAAYKIYSLLFLKALHRFGIPLLNLAKEDLRRSGLSFRSELPQDESRSSLQHPDFSLRKPIHGHFQ